VPDQATPCPAHQARQGRLDGEGGEAVSDTPADGAAERPSGPTHRAARPAIDRIVSPAPHIAAPTTCRGIMLWVIVALAPAAMWALWNMRLPALVVFACCIGSSVGTEWLWNAVGKRPQTIGDLSAVVTGLLLAMSLPPRTPWWMCIVGGLVAIGLAKMLFGGLGFNLFNPALVGRAVILMSWMGVMSEVKPYPGGWFDALSLPAPGKLDAISGATRLAIASADRAAQGAYAFDLKAQFSPLLLRNLQGSLGEVSAALLIAGGLLLIALRIIDWRIPAGYAGAVFVLSWALTGSIDAGVFHVLAGGVLLGAFFMATDYVTSPITRNGRLVFGLGCGLFNIVTRFYGPMPETTTFAILFMNGLAPMIDRMFMPKPFGWTKPVKEAKADA
jgi:electron transport complex protein RnfD